MTLELVIIGGGPAGLAAGIYAARAGIEAVVLEKQLAGGQILISPLIENWPGEKSITGMELAQKMKEHAAQYVSIRELEEVLDVKKESNTFHAKTSKESYAVPAVILATGATHRKLGVPGEEELTGKGVSYCATCDGFFFKEKDVIVVGGGNTAAIEAIYLQNLGVRTRLIHRRPILRAEQAYRDDIERLGIETILESRVVEIHGTEKVESIRVENVETGERKDISIDGVFISVGLVPQNEIATSLGARLNERGYVEVDEFQRTSVKGLYAAGDITGGARQIVTSCAQGAMAALASTEVLGKQYPF
ncbi:MAG: NAD(P)/FAD-dependent oxidoreductase [Thermoplasmata archaeon]